MWFRKTAVVASLFSSFFFARLSNAVVDTADQVVSYTQGSNLTTAYWGDSYAGPGNSWTSGPGLGLPVSTIGLAGNAAKGIFADNSVITPFNAQYNPPSLVGIGNNGVLEVHMSSPVSTSGFTLGVHAAVGLNDVSYPNGQNGTFGPKGVILPEADTYTDARSAIVMVSNTGGSNPSDWVTLNNGNAITFDAPTNFYTDLSSPQTSTPGNNVADFSQPFLVNGASGKLSSFDGQNWQGTLNVLNGSAGGTWLDLSGTGLSQVNYVKFITGATDEMFLNSIVGVPVPEPVAMGAIGITFLVLSKRR